MLSILKDNICMLFLSLISYIEDKESNIFVEKSRKKNIIVIFFFWIIIFAEFLIVMNNF